MAEYLVGIRHLMMKQNQYSISVYYRSLCLPSLRWNLTCPRAVPYPVRGLWRISASMLWPVYNVLKREKLVISD